MYSSRNLEFATVTVDINDNDNDKPVKRLRQPSQDAQEGILLRRQSTMNPEVVNNKSQTDSGALTALALQARLDAEFNQMLEVEESGMLSCLNISDDKNLLILFLFSFANAPRTQCSLPWTFQQFQDLLDGDDQFRSELQDACQERNFASVRRILQNKAKKLVREEQEQIKSRHGTSWHEQSKATSDSFASKYEGDACTVLWARIQEHIKTSTVEGGHMAIVQSSGTGKSRAVDELSKTHLVIPVCLRDEDPKNPASFPPPDHDVLRYLTGREHHGGNELRSSTRFSSFVEAVFLKVTEVVEHLAKEGDLTIPTLASKFRALMTGGQRVGEHNDFRRKLFKGVVEQAKTLEEYYTGNGSPAPEHPPVKAFKSLVQTIIKTCNVNEDTAEEPLVLLVFDEAQALTSSGPNESPFFGLHTTLRALRQLPLFTLFLATSWNLTHSVPLSSAKSSSDNRIKYDQLHPTTLFTDLGFDMLATKVRDGEVTLQTVSQEEYMMTIGRPLFKMRFLSLNKSLSDKIAYREVLEFAALKLVNEKKIDENPFNIIQKLACISQRIPIEFLSTQSVPAETRKAISDTERELVASHMRICLMIDGENENMETVAASEPFLSEASFLLMQAPNFDAPSAMNAVLSGFGIQPRHRGELVVLLLCTLARDSAFNQINSFTGSWTERFENRTKVERYIAVDQFLAALINIEHKDASGLVDQLAEFKDYRIYFNHFVKVLDNEVLCKPQFLAEQLTRGAAVACADGKENIDMAIPVLLPDCRYSEDDPLRYSIHSDRVRLICIKVEAGRRLGSSSHWNSCDAMSQRLNEKNGPASICNIVFALGSKTPTVEFGRYKRSDSYLNIWCAGLSPDVLPQVSTARQSVWEDILRACCPWNVTFEDKAGNSIKIRQSMSPGGAGSKGSFEAFFEVDARDDDDDEPAEPVAIAEEDMDMD